MTLQTLLRATGVLLCMTFVAQTAQAAHYLVEKGEARADIIIAPDAPPIVRLAAQDLQTYVARMTGATLPIVTQPAADVHVYVGRSRFTDSLGIDVADLDHDAYVMKSGDNWLALIGRDRAFEPPEPWMRRPGQLAEINQQWDKASGGTFAYPHTQLYKQYNKDLDIWEHDEKGSFCAVSDFLRAQGVRWYLPTALGEIVPKRTSIELPSVDKTVRPDFAMRYPYQWSHHFGHITPERNSEVLWQLRMGFNTGRDIIGLCMPTHGINAAHARQEIRDAHPEYFMLLNGERELYRYGVDRPGLTQDIADVGRPCLSSEGLLEQNVAFLRAVFDVYDEPGFSVQPQDGYGSLCQCDLCAGKNTPQLGWYGQLSNYVWGYIDRLAREVIKTHPDRKLNCFAYTSFRQPPTNVDTLPPNVLVGIAQGRGYFVNERARSDMLKLRQAWLDKLPAGSKQIMIGDYYLHARPESVHTGLPAYMPHIIAEDLQSLKGISLGDFIEVYRTVDSMVDMAVTHLNLYVTARCWWDADLDVDALLDDYYANFYGPARNEMKAFVEYGEKHFDAMRSDGEKITTALKLLDAAKKAAPAGSVYAKRIALVVDYTEPMTRRSAQLTVARDDTPTIRTAWESIGKLTVDGKLDDPYWAGVQRHRLKDLVDGGKPEVPGYFMVIWSEDNMCFAIHCDEPDTPNMPVAGSMHDDPSLWNGDAVEMLIETQLNNYYQIAINPAGTVVDLDRSGGAFNLLWSSQAQVATHIGDGYWSAEVRIPYVDEGQFEVDPNNGLAGKKPSATYPWYFNVCRQRIRSGGNDLTAYWPTGKPNFHDVSKFAQLLVK